MDDKLIANKLADLQQYLPFLTQVISNLKNKNNDKPRPQQLQKMEVLFSLISNKDKKPLKLDTLVKCETVLQKIYNKIEKQRDDSNNSSPVTVEFSTQPKTKDNQEIIEITEPDSPQAVDDLFHAPPIVIPTERKESPPPTASNHQYKGRKMNKWQNPNISVRRDDEFIDNNFRRRIPTIDRSRIRTTERFHFDRNYNIDYHQISDIYDNRRTCTGFEYDRRNFEKTTRHEISNETFDIPSTSDHYPNFGNKILRKFDYPNDRHFENNDEWRNRHNLINIESSENEFYRKNDYFQSHNNIPQSHSFSETLRNAHRDNYHRENIRNKLEDQPFSEWLQNRDRHRENVDYNKNTYDGRNTNFKESPPRSHSRNHNRKEDVTERIDRQENNKSPNWDVDNENPDLKTVNSHNNLIQIPITKNPQSTARNIKSNEQLNDSKPSTSKISEEFENSVFNRLGNKINISENFQIKVKNDRAIPVTKAPLIRDVLKSPPLTAHDIDELYHESGGADDKNFNAVRKKLAKISSKSKDNSFNKSLNSTQISSIKSPDPNRLAYKYNPHPRVSLDDALSPKSAESPKGSDNSSLKSPIDPRIQKQIQTANSLPSVNPNDPRLKTWCTEINTQIPASSNILNSPISSTIPCLLDLNIPLSVDDVNKKRDEPIIDKSNVNQKPIDSTLTNSPATSDNANYKKFHPHLNDQVERIKYLESKKNKPSSETTNDEASTYGEHRRKTEENKDSKRDSVSSFCKLNNNISKSSDRDSKNNEKVKNSKDTDKKSHRDKKQIENNSKHEKSKDFGKRGSDNMGNDSNNKNRNEENKIYPNCLDSMYRSSNYKKDLGSVATFKIPKKGKETDKEKSKEDNFKTNEKEINLEKTNMDETLKPNKEAKSVSKSKENTTEKIKKNRLSTKKSRTETSLSSLRSPAYNNENDIQELNDNKISPIKEIPPEKIKINLANKSSEPFPLASGESDSDDNWVVLSEIGTDNPIEESTENEENNSDKESSENKNIEPNTVVENLELSETKQDEKLAKPIRSRRKSVFEIVDSTSDNSILSIQNIISGKRRSRSAINLNENLLALSTVRLPATQTEPIATASTTKKTNTPKTGVKKKQPKKAYVNLSQESTSTQPSSNLTELSSTKPNTNPNLDYAISSTTVSEDPSQIFEKKEQISKDSLESFLLDMLNPATNKSRVLGMLAKVLDETKFQQVKKIIEDDDEDNKKELPEEKKIELKGNTNKSQLNVKVTEPKSMSIVRQASPVEKQRKRYKKLTELDRLNVDIRNMFISEGVLTATGRRMCTMMNAANEDRDVSVERPLSRLQSKLQTKPKNTIQNKKNSISLPKSSELSNLNKIPKVILSKVDISSIGVTVPTTKNRSNTKRRKRFSWSKGIISKKSKKLAGTKKVTDSLGDDNQIEGKIESISAGINSLTNTPKKNSTNINYEMPILKPITPDKPPKTVIREKPCPKSKKKYNFSSEVDSILIGDEPIISSSFLGEENTIFVEPSMPILTTSQEKEVFNLPKPKDLVNMSTLKNIYSGMHAKSIYSNKCVLCKFTGSKVANHYSANHPDSEIYISRLPPDTLIDLLAKKNNHALYSFRKQKIQVYHYRCPFCDIQQSFSQKSWIDHFSTHTGEYAYKCSNCSRSMNSKPKMTAHIQSVCPSGQIILRPQLSKDNKLVEAFVCKICNYVQMIEKNVIRHLKEQHNIFNSQKSKFDRIILINIQNIPILAGNEEQQQAALADTVPKTNMDFIDPNQSSETDKLDAFVPKEQNELSLDKSFLNYMNDVSFSTPESSSQILGKSSIIDQLSERLQSGNGNFDNSINSSDTRPIMPINRRYSIADQLSKRFKSVDQQNATAPNETNKITEHTIENNKSSDSPTPIVYILDNIDDDIENVELAESSEQLLVPVDKPISVARANKLNEILNGSNRNQDDSSPEKSSTSSSSIIARLNERFKSPQKKPMNKNKEILQEKASVSRPGTMIIDRLNKRLNSVDDREKPISETSLLDTQLSKELPLSSASTRNERDDLLDTSDDRLVIDESFDEETVLNEATGVFQPVKEYSKEIEDPELRKKKDTNCESVDLNVENIVDDDDWEDIEIIAAHNFDDQKKLQTVNSSNSPTDKNKNGTFYQTLSRLYAASIKSKNKSLLKNKKSLLKNKLTEEKKLMKKTKSFSDNSSISNLLPDLVTDAIPSPISNELTVDPPVPLPSEPLSDLNDISEILESPVTVETDSNSNNNNITQIPNHCNPINYCNIDDEDIFILNDVTNIEDALALAAEIEKTSDLRNEIELKLNDNSLMVNETSSELNTDINITTISTTIELARNNNNVDKDKMDSIDSSQTSTTYRIDKLGFSITNGNIKYLCLVESCSFLYSELDIGLQSHYTIEHPNLTWDGFCYSCESVVCFGDEHLPLIRELKHMNEVHINNIRKINNSASSDTREKNSPILEKPKISLRRLSGDMLSIQPTTIYLNEDDILLSNNITNSKSSSAPCTSQTQSQNTNSHSGNKTIVSSETINSLPENLIKTVQSSQNISIKELLNTPSVPPPIPINLNENRSKSPVVLNSQLGMGSTKSFLLQNQSKSRKSSLLKTLENLKCYLPAKASAPRNTPAQPIKNNSLGGSHLVISSVAEGVSLPTKIANNHVVVQPATELVSLLKIQSVCSLNSNQIQLSDPVTAVQQETVKTSEPTTAHLSPKLPISSTEPIIGNQSPLTTKIIPTSSNAGSIIVSKHTTENRLQPWQQSFIAKPDSVVQLQLRAISLFAFYKCMNLNCFFTTNCSDKLTKHFICHEFSGATTNESATLQSNINYRDWLNCSYCKYHAESTEQLLKHLNEIHLNDIYQCSYCFYRSCCESNVQQHQKSYHCGKKPLIYVGFGERKIFASEVRHLIKNRAKYLKSIPCNDCPKVFYTIRNYMEHLRENHNSKSSCYTCGICKIILHKKNASYHLNSSHHISIYQCIHCNISSSVRSRMIVHMTDDHPSNLLYSSIRVAPKKDVNIAEETIENSTVLANLTTPVDPSTLIECNFTLEQLNFMSPSLDAKSLLDNRSGTFILTNSQVDINNTSPNKIPSPPQQNLTKNLKIISVESLSNKNDTNTTDLMASYSVNAEKASTNESSTTLKISSILQNCPKYIVGQSILKSSLNINITNSNNEIATTNLNSVEVPDKNSESINESDKNTSSTETSNDDNLNDRIIKAAKELVQDTGYEGFDLFRCADPKCININLTELTLYDHIQRTHPRARTFKCPHCTSQYQNVKTLKHHLNTHRMHKYFCYFCNYTTVTQHSITKHVNDSHSKSVNTITTPLAYPNCIQNKQDDIFYVTCPNNTTKIEILQYGERLIRICERKKSLTKKSFKPAEIDQLPIQSIFHHEVICSQCNYKTKVRTNMYRHLLYHTKEVAVPSIDPVNPVPCLNANQKHYDKMINLACSSNINKDINNSNSNDTITTKSIEGLLTKLNETNNVTNPKTDINIPIYIPKMKRYVCGVNGCNYLTINDSMLKHHLNALHLTEKSYKCAHCKIECVKKQFCPEKIIQHLKFHDSKIFVCSNCSYMHYQKHLVDRHIYEKHPTKSIDVIIRYERTDTETIVQRQSYCGSLGTQSNIRDINKSNTNTTNVDDNMAWECTICKHRTVTSLEMNSHVITSHNIRFRYACLHCKFGAGQFKTVMDHITDKHPTKDRKLKCAFNRIDESPITDDFLQQDNRPLWSRVDPYRVKHIRGILMEEEDEQPNTTCNSVQKISTNSNNKVVKPKTNTKLIRTKLDLQNSEKNNKNSSGTEQISGEKIITEKTTTSNNESNNIDIYECSFCPIKNITFKTIYTHWFLHHLEKPSRNNNPLLTMPFSFRLWGFMSRDSSQETELKEMTEDDLKRLQRLGQKATRFQCSECWRLFANCSSVNVHQETEHINKPTSRCLQYNNVSFYICNFCGYSSTMECKTAAHLLNHYGGFKKCHMCNLEFDTLLDFACHLYKHDVTFKDFIENDKEILTFWDTKIKILFPNGLCIQRGVLPNNLNNTLLQQLVIEQVRNALLKSGNAIKDLESKPTNSVIGSEKESISELEKNTKTETVKESTTESVKESTTESVKDTITEKVKDSTTESVKESITESTKELNDKIVSNEQNENNADNDAITVLSITSESESVNSTNTVSKESINKTKTKKRKKRTKDNDEWMPSNIKKRKVQIESDDEDKDEDEDDDYDVPLKFLTDDKLKSSTSTDSNDSTIIIPKRKPGPKCMQRKPYSFYGLTPEKIDLKNIYTTMKLPNDKPVVVSCENFARFVNIDPKIYIEKIDMNKFDQNKSNKFEVTYKRKLSHLINNIIDEQLGYSMKKLKEST